MSRAYRRWRAAIPLALLQATLQAQEVLHTFTGATNGDHLGYAVSGAGDVDGDGIPDLIVGALPNHIGKPGHVKVFSGLDGTVLRAVFSPFSNEELGSAVNGPGDLNGDGHADFLAGAPGTFAGAPGAGSARAYSGADGSLLHYVAGAAGGDGFGSSIGGGGDFDGDGSPDLVVGAVGSDQGGPDSGAVTVLSGASGSVLLTIYGASAGDALGTSVSVVGDVDGDGFADFVAGAPGDDSTGVDGGAAAVYSGEDGSVLHTFVGAGGSFGHAVSGAGDVDGDGFDDVVVGAYGDRAAWVYSGVDGSTLFALAQNDLEFEYGGLYEPRFGYSVSGAGDFDADGHDDVVVGSIANPGTVSCGLSAVRVFSGRDGSVLANVSAGHAEELGRSVSGAGDVNGDGFADIVVGAPENISAGCNLEDPGFAQVFAGSHHAPAAPQDPLHALAGAGVDELFGTSVDGVGDVNGDGHDDVVVGAVQGPPDGPYAGPGVARVHSGSDGSVLHTLAGGAAGDHFGDSVAGAGDVDGDGTPDVIVGTSLPFGLGYARVFSGGTGSVIATLTSGVESDRFGSAVDGAGDVNGDGRADLIVGAFAHATTDSYAGRARVLSGSDGSVVHDWIGASSYDQLGFSVSAAGDTDGDGVSDVIVGANQIGSVSPGYALVQSGANGSTLHVLHGVGDGQPGSPTRDDFGWSVRGTGDVNGDGFGDVVVGAPDRFGDGYARIFSGVDGAVLFELEGSSERSRFGYSVGGPGDVDADGVPDILVGARDHAEVAGAKIGSATVYSGADGSILRTFLGTAGSWFGSAVNGAGDANGDGLPDVVVGAPRLADHGSDSGGARIHSVLPAPFGAGCAGSLGAPAVIGSTGSVPGVGAAGASVVLLGAPPSVGAVLVAGGSATDWLGAALPLDLEPFGLAGCFLRVAPEVVLPWTTDPGGSASVKISVPAQPSLAGKHLYFQWAVCEVDPPLSTTAGLRAIIAP